MRRDLLLLCAAVLLIRLPFLDQAVQGDDVYYLLIAQNALVDPLHPMQMGFRLQGELVWAAGHTRPPFNAYVLAGLLAIFGEVEETYFHLIYLLFSLTAVVSMYFLARRFSNRPLLATLVFLAVPAFVVNGNKLEADLPLLALWLLGFCLFVHQRFIWAAVALAAAGLCAYQSLFGVLILAHYAWHRAGRGWAAWIAVVAAPAAIGGWQLFERLSTGTAPAAVLAGYFETYNLLALETKLDSALALTAHLGFMVSPLLVVAMRWPVSRKQWLLPIVCCGFALVPVALLGGYTGGQRVLLWVAVGSGLIVLAGTALQLVKEPASDDGFLAVWIWVFFLCSVAIFYAGSARYLLPLAPALALLVARHVRETALLGALGLAHLVLGLSMARAEYEYAGQYRAFAERLAPVVESKRLWTNAEWGLRYYLERLGGEPLLRGQPVYPGSVVVMSELAAAIPYEAQGMKSELLRSGVHTASVPLRHIGLGSRAGYSSANFGVLPIDLGAGLIDRLTVYGVGIAQPTTGYLTMNAPEAEEQLLSGFYNLEDGTWRWMGPRGSALLLVPEGASQFELVFYIHDLAPARRVTVAIDGETIADETYPGEGRYTLRAPFSHSANRPVEVAISVDQAFQPPGDERELGIVVHAFGLKP